MIRFVLLLTLGIFVSSFDIKNEVTMNVAPVLLVHGIGVDGYWDVVQAIGDGLGTYSVGYSLGDDPGHFSIYHNIKEQGGILGDKIRQDEHLMNGNFSLIGVSQGAVISKYIIEEGQLEKPIRNFITFGGPNMGVSVFPRHPRDNWQGYFLTELINFFVYWDIGQWFIAPGDYWRDPTNIKGYLKHSHFLAEANNEVHFNQSRKDAWLNINRHRFIKWKDDMMIIPRESSWWGTYDEHYNEITRFETDVYQNDLLGIRTLEEQGRADFIEIEGDHMHNIIGNLGGIVFPILVQ